MRARRSVASGGCAFPGIDQVAGNFRDELHMALGPRQNAVIDPVHVIGNQADKRIKARQRRISTSPKGNDHTHKVAILLLFSRPE
jgi:hypothetical protein